MACSMPVLTHATHACRALPPLAACMHSSAASCSASGISRTVGCCTPPEVPNRPEQLHKCLQGYHRRKAGVLVRHTALNGGIAGCATGLALGWSGERLVALPSSSRDSCSAAYERAA